MDFKNFLKTRQHAIVLAAGYVLVGMLGFGLGRLWAVPPTPEIRVEQAFAPLHDNAETPSNQSPGAGAPPPPSGDCRTGQVKGNISGSGKVYHLPGGSFYNRTVAEACFDSEAQAIEAGFRKSSR